MGSKENPSWQLYQGAGNHACWKTCKVEIVSLPYSVIFIPVNLMTRVLLSLKNWKRTSLISQNVWRLCCLGPMIVQSFLVHVPPWGSITSVLLHSGERGLCRYLAVTINAGADNPPSDQSKSSAHLKEKARFFPRWYLCSENVCLDYKSAYHVWKGTN